MSGSSQPLSTSPSTRDTVTDPQARTLRRAGGWLVASGLAGVAAVAAVVTVEVAGGYADAAQQAADRRGVAVEELPPDVLAEIYGNPTWGDELLLAVPLTLVAVLFVVGMRRAAADGRGGLAVAAVGLAVLCAVSWVGVLAGSGLVEVERLDVQRWVEALVVLTVAAGAAAVAALAVDLRGRGVARRTGAVVAVLGVLALVGCFALPPVLPFLLAGVLGAALTRTRSADRPGRGSGRAAH